MKVVKYRRGHPQADDRAKGPNLMARATGKVASDAWSSGSAVVLETCRFAGMDSVCGDAGGFSRKDTEWSVNVESHYKGGELEA